MEKYKKNKGITLIALIVTIVIMLILATVTIGAINGGLFGYARKSKIQTEIVDLKEQLEQKKIMSKTKITDGKINDILNVDSPYNDKLEIENEELVYIKNKWNLSDIEALEEMGINERLIDIITANTSTIYYIVNATTKTAKYPDLTNVGTLEDFRTKVNTNQFTYDEAKLMEDIKLNEGKYTITNGEITFAEDAAEWTPIGRYSNVFTKIFDGQNHTISGIYYNNSDTSYMGLFNEVNGATIKNLGVINCKIIAKQHCGGIVGLLRTGNIFNSYVKNSIINAVSGAAGGIVGTMWEATAEVRDCYNIGSSISCSNASNSGGICGSLKGRIERCFNKGKVEGRNSIGGIVGNAQSGSEVFNCYNVGECESSSGYHWGGIAGENSGTMANCYTTIGTLKGTTVNSYYLVETETEDTSSKTESQMKSQSFVTILNTVTTNGTSTTQDVWKMDTNNKNNGFPILKWQK